MRSHVACLQEWLQWSDGTCGDMMAGQPGGLLALASYVARHLDGEKERPDRAACVSSGLFDLCLEAVAAFAAGGVETTQTVSRYTLYCTLSLVARCYAHPKCDEKVRREASALGFCLEHSITLDEEFGQTSGSLAAQICAFCVCFACGSLRPP